MPSRWYAIAAALLVGLLSPLIPPARAQLGSTPKPRTKSLLVRVSTSLNKRSPARNSSPVLKRTTGPKNPAKNSRINRPPAARPQSAILKREGPPRLPAGILERPGRAYPPSKILARKIHYKPANPNILERKPPARPNRTLLNKKPPPRSNVTLLDRPRPERPNNTYRPSGPPRPEHPKANRFGDEPYPAHLRRFRDALAKHKDPSIRAYVLQFDQLIAEREYRRANELFREAVQAEKVRKAGNTSANRRGR